MLITRFIAAMFSVGLMVLGVGVVVSQDYPSKPIRIITSESGGGTDFMSRLIAQGISGALGQPVIVDNRGGSFASGEAASKAPPDGYTLLVAGGSFTVETLLRKSPYDPVRDFLPITLATRASNILVVHPSLPVQSIKELIALAKARPGELNHGSGGVGTSNHIAGELFKYMAGVNIVHVAYKGSGAVFVDLLRGEVHMGFGGPDRVVPLVKLGKLRALAVTSAEPSALAPGLPAMATFLPGYESVSLTGMFAPAKTPAAIVKRLNQEVVLYLNQPNVKQRVLDGGEEVIANSPAEFEAKIKAEMARMSKLIKDVGIRAD